MNAPTSEKQVTEQKSSSHYACTHAYQFHQLLQEWDQLQELIVILVNKPALNGDAIGQLQRKRHNTSQSQILLNNNKNKQTTKHTNLVRKGLRWVVNYYSFGQISPKYVKVFDVVSLDTYAVLTKQSVPNYMNEISEYYITIQQNLNHKRQKWSRFYITKMPKKGKEKKRKKNSPQQHIIKKGFQKYKSKDTWVKATDLTSCFLGSRMFNSLSAYTFFEAVKRIICKRHESAFVSQYILKEHKKAISFVKIIPVCSLDNTVKQNTAMTKYTLYINSV